MNKIDFEFFQHHCQKFILSRGIFKEFILKYFFDWKTGIALIARFCISLFAFGAVIMAAHG